MTPAEHYREAERIIAHAERQAARTEGAPAHQVASLAAIAQVHATLATAQPDLERRVEAVSAGLDGLLNGVLAVEVRS